MESNSVNIIQVIGTVSATLSCVVAGIISVIALHIQRDMAQLENKILAGINGKYLSRNEHEIICRDHEEVMRGAREEAREARQQHNVLHEEFIACRSSHGGKR